MTYIAFELSMPNAGSWNGKWSGEGRCYARVKKFYAKDLKGELGDRLLDILGEGYFYYTWDDGWTACVTVREVDAKEAAKLIKKSVGFYSYDWMIDSIMKHKKIIIERG